MKLNEVLKNIQPLKVIGDAEVEVTGVNIDSRSIQNGHLFIAMKGTQVDGHKFISKAIELGAKSILCEDLPKEIADSLNISYFTVVTHKKNIYKKLGINHSLELAQYAIKTGLMK